MFRADLGADGASGAHQRVNFYLLILDEKSRARQIVDAVAVIFKPGRDKSVPQAEEKSAKATA
ncbi:MAG: hypothetical protein Q8P24_02980 [Desulfobacterales bacterium]|nr:hypothetical protein [Desulfobacterales bacterium]